MNWRRKSLKPLLALLLVAVLAWSFTGCSQPSAGPGAPIATKSARSKLAEVSPPFVLQNLKQSLESYQPQVKILTPRPNQTLEDTDVTVKIQVNDLPLFKDEDLGLGPYVQVILDNQPYAQLHDLSEPLAIDHLTPGTHTIRALAVRPWHESFKNEAAYAQTTFHIFTPTPDNALIDNQPLLTYNYPQGTYGAEPILLDFYLTNAPLHLVAREDAEDAIPDWQIRCTINGDSFTFDRWEPIYLKGFKPGKNWVQLELLDDRGNPIPNAFNNTVQLITYEPGGSDILAQLTRGELTADAARKIVDPNYVPPPEPVEPEPEIILEPDLTEEPVPETMPPELVAPAEESVDVPENPPENSSDDQPAAIEPAVLPEPVESADQPTTDHQELELPSTAIDSVESNEPESVEESEKDLLLPTQSIESEESDRNSASESVPELEPDKLPERLVAPNEESTVELIPQPSAVPAAPQEVVIQKPALAAPAVQPTPKIPEISNQAAADPNMEENLKALEQELEKVFQAPMPSDPELEPEPSSIVQPAAEKLSIQPLAIPPVPVATEPVEPSEASSVSALDLNLTVEKSLAPATTPQPDLTTPDLVSVFDRVKDFFEGLRKRPGDSKLPLLSPFGSQSTESQDVAPAADRLEQIIEELLVEPAAESSSSANPANPD